MDDHERIIFLSVFQKKQQFCVQSRIKKKKMKTILLFVIATIIIGYQSIDCYNFDYSNFLPFPMAKDVVANADAVTTPPAPCGISPIPLDPEMNETMTAKLGQVVWHVAVESKGLIGGIWKLSCGGVVISPMAVLTAASCVDG